MSTHHAGRRLAFALVTMVIGMMLGAAPASAHVSISPGTAPEGSTQTFSLDVGHDCDGSPTSRVSADLSVGLDQVETVPLEGWQIGYESGVMTWTADPGFEGSTGSFRFSARVTAAAGSLVPVPLIQECPEGRYDWIQVAGPGENPGVLAAPAPLFRVSEGTPVTTTAAPTTTTTAAPTTTTSTAVPATTTSPPTTTAAPDPTTTTTAPTTTAPEDDGDGGSAAPLAIGALAIAAVAGGTVFAIRRRNA